LRQRSSRAVSIYDQPAGTIFGVVAIGLIVHFSVLALKLLSRPTDERRGLVLLTIRYACLSVMITFQGRRT
jgi:hypothetical protein